MSKVESKEDSTEIGMCTDFKPGQKFSTPAPGNGDRVFYETLLKQKPSSEMAQDWCLAYGILEHDESAKLYKKVCQRKGVVPIKSSSTSSKPKPKKSSGGKILDDGVADEDFDGEGHVWEGQGSIGL